jgi:hypothetical protein
VGLDRRIQDGNAIKELLDSKGWSLIANRLTELRAEAHQNLMVNEDSKWRYRLHSFDEALGILDEFLRDKEMAENEQKENKLYGRENDAGDVSDDERDSSDISSG